MEYKKKIIITGGCGFIGSNFLNKFVLQYPEYLFINVDCLTYAGRMENITITDKSNYTFEKVDIKNVSALEKVFITHSPTHVIHFAAESHVDISIENPALFVETNVIGTHNLLLLAKKYSVQRFHQISTDEVYGSLTLQDEPFTNSSPLAPNSPYSASKAAADLLVRSYHETFGMNVVITRCSNNYGPFQDTSKLIPKAIVNLLNGTPVPIYARGEHIRDWIYVGDHIDAIDLVFHKGLSGQIYNIGGNQELKNIDLVHKLATEVGASGNYTKFVEDRKGHDFRYAISNAHIEQELGWKPRVNLDTGLKKTVAFYRERHKA